MMSQNFENIVKEAFENFEADVNPQAWTNIQQGLQVAPPAPAQPSVPVSSVIKTASSISKLAVTYITVSAVILISVVGAFYYLNNNNEKVQSNPESKGTKLENKVNIPEVKSSLSIVDQAKNEKSNAPLIQSKSVEQKESIHIGESVPNVADNHNSSNEKVKTRDSEPAQNISNGSDISASSQGRIASSTRGSRGVVALWSR